MTLFSIQVRKHSIIHLNNLNFFFNENVTTNCFWFYGEMWLWNDKVKAIVHTKMKIVILYSSSRMLVTKWLVAIDYRQLFSYQYSSKDLLLSLREEKKKLEAWMMTLFSFLGGLLGGLSLPPSLTSCTCRLHMTRCQALLCGMPLGKLLN